MRAMVVREYGTVPVVCEVPSPPGPAADVLAASLNPVDLTVAAGLNPFRRPELPLVLGIDGVARRADGVLVHFFAPAPPYSAFAERVPLADTATVPLPAGLPASRVTGVIRHEAARQAPLRLGAGTVVTSQDLPTLTESLLEPDQRGYDVILDTLWGPVIPAAIDAAAPGARVVHLGNSAGALATLAGPVIRKNGISILTYAIFTVPARERTGAFTRLAQHAAAGELTLDYHETALEALPAIWDDLTAGRPQTKIIVKPNETAP